MTNSHHLNSYWKKTDLSLIAAGIQKLANEIYKVSKGLTSPHLTKLCK